MVLGLPHFLASLLDHRFLGERLTAEQKEQAYEYFNSTNTDFVPFVMALTSKSKPFPYFMYGPNFKKTSPLLWRKSVPIAESACPDKNIFIERINQLLTAVASTAGIERCFSSFGLVHFNLRNNLGTEKTAKLVFMFKYLNSSSYQKHDNLEWIWPEQETERRENEEAELSLGCFTGFDSDTSDVKPSS
uniref:Uncharacterized protein LOC114346059 n=1 Tax=Diabrotica virgifera virgifera TaxID=50390 RepID=A0A6P7H4Q9_DIAVI